MERSAWPTSAWSEPEVTLFIALQILMQDMDVRACAFLYLLHSEDQNTLSTSTSEDIFGWSEQPQRPVWRINCGFICILAWSLMPTMLILCFHPIKEQKKQLEINFVISLQTISNNSVVQGVSLFVASDWYHSASPAQNALKRKQNKKTPRASCLRAKKNKEMEVNHNSGLLASGAL